MKQKDIFCNSKILILLTVLILFCYCSNSKDNPPDILTFEQLLEIDYETPYILDFQKGNKHLVFYGSYHSNNPSDEIITLFQREFGFDYMIDKSTGKIIQVRMDSGITGAQRYYKIPLDRKLVEDVVIEMFERIDPDLLDPKYYNLKWMENHTLLIQPA